MRTSQIQMAILIDFMEQNGDLSKPSSGPHGRQYNHAKWRELTTLLNAEPSGDARPEEKWRKVWSDYKNFTKRKFMKIKSAANGTGGGPPLNISLTENETRVLSIITPQAATGSLLPEAGGIPQISHTMSDHSYVSQNYDHSHVSHMNVSYMNNNNGAESTSYDIPGTSSHMNVSYMNNNNGAESTSYDIPGTSSQITLPTNIPSPPPPSPPVDRTLSPPPLKRKKRMVPDKKQKKEDAAGFFRECERNNWHVQQEIVRQRDEELRLRELELRERQEARLTSERQREQELRVQERLLDLMAEFMNVLKRMGDKG